MHRVLDLLCIVAKLVRLKDRFLLDLYPDKPDATEALVDAKLEVDASATRSPSLGSALETLVLVRLHPRHARECDRKVLMDMGHACEHLRETVLRHVGPSYGAKD